MTSLTSHFDRVNFFDLIIKICGDALPLPVVGPSDTLESDRANHVRAFQPVYHALLRVPDLYDVIPALLQIGTCMGVNYCFKIGYYKI